ncbi:multidrug MFS transporter [Streptomyces alboflavus]|uniref:Multidrug MFS transporter n=1 Tax=Streptomyces alboflavus TaxID=67267 RepID=A0A1Z1WRQ7_9ACTN|nr:multidrug MFS transporter [Streptomyces alboflavus]
MIAARVAAGVSAAMIMPITLAVITSTFPAEQRGKAIGVWTGVAGGGGILGMFLSALLVDVADWRRLFVLPVVLVVVALVMTLKSVPNSRRDAAHSFDTTGASLSAVAVIGLIFVLQEGPERGWTAPVTLTGLAVGILAAVGFVAWELRRRDAALLDCGCSVSAAWPGARSRSWWSSGSRRVSPWSSSRSSRPSSAGPGCCPPWR